MINDMQGLWPILLPTSKPEGIDQDRYDDEIRANEDKLNQNFKFIQGQLTALYEYLKSKE